MCPPPQRMTRRKDSLWRAQARQWFAQASGNPVALPFPICSDRASGRQRSGHVDEEPSLAACRVPGLTMLHHTGLHKSRILLTQNSFQLSEALYLGDKSRYRHAFHAIADAPCDILLALPHWVTSAMLCR